MNMRKIQPPKDGREFLERYGLMPAFEKSRARLEADEWNQGFTGKRQENWLMEVFADEVGVFPTTATCTQAEYDVFRERRNKEFEQ
jgi:hypothetical protein